MEIIKHKNENPIETTCNECNTLFSFVLPEVKIVEYEYEDGIVNVRRKWLFKREYWSSVYKCKKAVINCPVCDNEIKVDGYMSKDLKSVRIGEKIHDRKDLHYIYP